MATYDKLKNKLNNHAIQVQSAIEDGAGENIQNNYAKQDGYYQCLTAGLSDNFNSRMTLTDKSPYLFRSLGGSFEVGNKCFLKSITGGTIVFNQIAINGNFSDGTNKWEFINGTGSVSNNELTYTSNLTQVTYLNYKLFRTVSVVPDHKYLISFAYKSNANFSASATPLIQSGVACAASETYVRQIVIWSGRANPANNDWYFYNYTNPKSEAWVLNLKEIEVIDLTVMFGSAIADYIYNLESGSAGVGVAWFKQFFPKDYYGYDMGSVLSVKTTSKKIVGFNAYNHAMGSATLLGGHEYQISGTYLGLAYDDINGDSEMPTLDANCKFTPKNDGILYVAGGNSTDTCVHLVWDGERNGEYEPYSETVYPIETTDLYGFLELDGNNNLYYDGDEYQTKGRIIRKYAVETLTNNYAVSDTIIISDMATDTSKLICKHGHLSEWGTVSGTSVTLTKALGIGDVIVYELAAYTSEPASAVSEKQIIDNWGTEEYVDPRTIPVPVGHITEYLPDLKAKVEIAPESPQTDGYYVMKRINKNNVYSPLSSWLSLYDYVKKEEIALTNLGAITSSALVNGTFFRNDISVNGGINENDVIYIKTSANSVYPAVNNGTTLTVFCASNLSLTSIVKAWKL